MTNLHKLDIIAGYSVASLVVLGGVMGFVKARSLPSLLAGGGAGLLLAYGVYRNQSNAKDVAVVLASSAVLVAIMGPKYLKTGKIIPAGLVTAMASGVLVRFGYKGLA